MKFILFSICVMKLDSMAHALFIAFIEDEIISNTFQSVYVGLGLEVLARQQAVVLDGIGWYWMYWS